VAQRAAPDSRIVYVDNDPIVLTHARALLTSGSAGTTEYIQADMQDPGKILGRAVETLDFGQPVAVLLIAILHFIPDTDDPYGIVARLLDAVPSGSYLVLTHAPSDINAGEVARATEHYNQRSSTPIIPRSRGQVLRFFDGLEVLEPGVVTIDQWPVLAQADSADPNGLATYCGIGMKD
jgi:hypothetical protein